MTANDQAKRAGLSAGSAVTLAVLFQPIGWTVFFVLISLGLDGPASGAIGFIAGTAVLYASFAVASPDSKQTADVRTAKYAFFYALFFAVEFAVGIPLLVFFVIPYLIVAALVSAYVINSHHKNLTVAPHGAPGWTPPPPGWTPPPPTPPQDSVPFPPQPLGDPSATADWPTEPPTAPGESINPADTPGLTGFEPPPGWTPGGEVVDPDDSL